MLKRVTIIESGDADFLTGQLVERGLFESGNRAVVAEGGKPASARPEAFMGITKASLATESWLSAASFQETTRVLTEAAIEAKSDPLLGLKENVIIGKLVPRQLAAPLPQHQGGADRGGQGGDVLIVQRLRHLVQRWLRQRRDQLEKLPEPRRSRWRTTTTATSATRRRSPRWGVYPGPLRTWTLARERSSTTTPPTRTSTMRPPLQQCTPAWGHPEPRRNRCCARPCAH